MVMQEDAYVQGMDAPDIRMSHQQRAKPGGRRRRPCVRSSGGSDTAADPAASQHAGDSLLPVYTKVFLCLVFLLCGVGNRVSANQKSAPGTRMH